MLAQASSLLRCDSFTKKIVLAKTVAVGGKAGTSLA